MPHLGTDLENDGIRSILIKTIDGPRIFGVTRQTLSCWINGKTKVPRAAFIALLEFENASAAATVRVQERMAAIKEMASRIQSGNSSMPSPKHCRRRRG